MRVFWKQDYGKLCGLDNEVINGMSAIVRIFTSEGFLVAADGRGIGGLPGVPDRDDFQKIFPLSHDSGTVIASVCGISQLRKENDEVLDIGVALADAAFKAKPKLVSDVHGYAALLVKELRILVGDFSSDTISASLDKQTIIFLDGLFTGMMPGRETIRITYGETCTAVSSNADDLSIAAYASQKIWNMLFGNMPIVPVWITSYRETCQGARKTLKDALGVAQAAIIAHTEPEARAIDPAPCSAIGGRIHIATLTPGRGFEWVPGFEPKAGGAKIG